LEQIKVFYNKLDYAEMISDYIKLSSGELSEETKQTIFKNYLTNKLKMKSKFNDISFIPQQMNENPEKNQTNSLNLSSEQDTSFRTLDRQKNFNNNNNNNYTRFLNIPDKKSESVVIEAELQLDSQI
jgi:hypothetical protein